MAAIATTVVVAIATNKLSEPLIVQTFHSKVNILWCDDTLFEDKTHNTYVYMMRWTIEAKKEKKQSQCHHFTLLNEGAAKNNE